MEKTIDRQVEQISKIPGVTSVVCCDNHGLTLSGKGPAMSHSSGLVAGLTDLTQKLHPEKGVAPVIVMETESSSVLIKRHNNANLAIFKST